MNTWQYLNCSSPSVLASCSLWWCSACLFCLTSWPSMRLIGSYTGSYEQRTGHSILLIPDLLTKNLTQRNLLYKIHSGNILQPLLRIRRRNHGRITLPGFVLMRVRIVATPPDNNTRKLVIKPAASISRHSPRSFGEFSLLPLPEAMVIMHDWKSACTLRPLFFPRYQTTTAVVTMNMILVSFEPRVGAGTRVVVFLPQGFGHAQCRSGTWISLAPPQDGPPFAKTSDQMLLIFVRTWPNMHILLRGRQPHHFHPLCGHANSRAHGFSV